MTFFLAAAMWLLLAGLWGGRSAIAIWRHRLRFPPRYWARWLSVPITMSLFCAILSSSAPLVIRFELSRGAMNKEPLGGG